MFKQFIFLALAIAAVQAKYPGEEKVLKELNETKENYRSIMLKVFTSAESLIDDESKAAEKRGGSKSYSCANISGQTYISKINDILFADFGASAYYCHESEQKIKDGKLSMDEFNEVVSTLETLKKEATETVMNAMARLEKYTAEFEKIVQAC